MKKLSLLVLPDFIANAESMPKDKRAKLFKILKLLSENIRHPSLQCKKIKGKKENVYECRVDKNIRLIYDITPGFLRCWYIGEHDLAIAYGRNHVKTSIELDDFEIEEIDESLMSIYSYLNEAKSDFEFQEYHVPSSKELRI